jgi:hypothetical protein
MRTRPYPTSSTENSPNIQLSKESWRARRYGAQSIVILLKPRSRNTFFHNEHDEFNVLRLCRVLEEFQLPLEQSETVPLTSLFCQESILSFY